MSSWATLILFMVELLLVDRYIRSGQFSKDRFWIQGIVLTLIMLDTLGAIISCASAWKVCLLFATPRLRKLMSTGSSFSLNAQVCHIPHF